jgi:two-component system, sensor histidine kinase and response regulator
VENRISDISGDEAKLERVLSNLVGNALKFTEKGSVRLSLEERGGGQVLRVEDTGPGIPVELQDKLFTKFFRATNTQEGAGLGLSIVKGFVEAHGGRITVESRLGHGSVFTVTLPR